MMTKTECLQWMAANITNEITVTPVAGVCRDWEAMLPEDKRELHIFKGWMSSTTPIAFGLALALPHRTVVSLDGDGSILMGLSILAAIAHKNPPNLIVIIWDNGCYEFREGSITKQNPTLTADVADLTAIAKGSGIKSARDVRELPEFQAAYQQALKTKGPHFITAKVPPEFGWIKPVSMDSQRSKYRFIKHIEKTEKLLLMESPYRPKKGKIGDKDNKAAK